jgi:hypothetical protein
MAWPEQVCELESALRDLRDIVDRAKGLVQCDASRRTVYDAEVAIDRMERVIFLPVEWRPIPKLRLRKHRLGSR